MVLSEDFKAERTDSIAVTRAEAVEELPKRGNCYVYLTVCFAIRLSVGIIVGVTVGIDNSYPPAKADAHQDNESATSQDEAGGSDDGGFSVFPPDDELAFLPETIYMDRILGQGWTALAYVPVH